MRGLRGLWALLALGLSSAGCVSVGPPIGPVVLSEREGAEGAVRWSLGPDEAFVSCETASLPGSWCRAKAVLLPHARERLRSGIGFGLMEPEVAARVFGLEDRTILVTYVLPGSPAWLAGLRRGDRVLEVDGAPPGTPGEIVSRLETGSPGHRVSMRVEGGDGRHELAFDLEEDVEARSGTDLGLLYGSEGWSRRWDSWALGGLGWWSVRTWWDTQRREPEGYRNVEVLGYALRYESDPRGSFLWVAWVVPIPLPW